MVRRKKRKKRSYRKAYSHFRKFNGKKFALISESKYKIPKLGRRQYHKTGILFRELRRKGKYLVFIRKKR